MNRAFYDECFSRQPDDTLDMLQEKARTLGAKAVIGVRLVPMVDERGIRVMMAYGTGMASSQSAVPNQPTSTIHIIAQGGYGGHTLGERLKEALPHAEITVTTRHEIQSMSANTAYIVAGYDELLEPNAPIRPVGHFWVYGADESLLTVIKSIGQCSLCDRSRLLELVERS